MAPLVAALAQLVEHIIRNDGVTGSSPVSGTTSPTRQLRDIRPEFLPRGNGDGSCLGAVPAPSPLPNVVKNLGRADLIALAQRAADSFASGEAPPKEVEDAAGRRFSRSLPFGCTGPSDAESGLSMRWQYDENAEVLRVTVDPARWTAADWNLDDENAATTAEGFWIGRPWLSGEACPARA